MPQDIHHALFLRVSGPNKEIFPAELLIGKEREGGTRYMDWEFLKILRYLEYLFFDLPKD